MDSATFNQLTQDFENEKNQFSYNNNFPDLLQSIGELESKLSQDQGFEMLIEKATLNFNRGKIQVVEPDVIYQKILLNMENDEEELRHNAIDKVESFMAFLCSEFIGMNNKNGYPVYPFVCASSWNKVKFVKEKGLIPIEENNQRQYNPISLDLQELARFTTILSKASELLKKNTYITKRDFFYTYKNVYGSPNICYKYIETISDILELPNWSLNFLASAKGIASGSLKYTLNGHIIDFSKSTIDGIHISPSVFKARDWESDAHFVLVVEKDAMFKRLLRDNILYKLGPMILVTGCGFPDFATRIFLSILWKKFQKPTFIITDGNPAGGVIMSIYKYGPMIKKEKHENLPLLKARWLGVLPKDLQTYKIDHNVLQSLDASDRRYAKTFKKICEKYNEKEWLTECKRQLFDGKKCEMECFDSIDSAFLVDTYIPEKINNKDYL